MADPTSFEWQLQDDQGLTNRTQIYAAYDGATETVDALIGAWLATGALLDATVDGRIIGGAITIPLLGYQDNPTWKQTANNGNNVNQVMSLNFGNDFNSFVTPMLLPSYRESQVNATPPRAPNLAATALAALIANVIDDEGTVFYNSRDIHQLDKLVDAFLTVRKVRGGRARTKVTG